MRNKIHRKIKQYIRPYKLNIYLALLYRIVIMLIFFQQGRILFYMLNNKLFPDTSIFTIPQLMLGGIVFDLTAVLYINSLFILLQILPFRFTSHYIYQRVCKWIFIITNSLAVVVNMADIAYFRFTLRRTTAIVFKEFSNESNWGQLIGQFVFDYWYLIIITSMIITGICVTYKLISVKPLKIRNNFLYYPTALAVMAVVAALFVGGVRGGFAHSTRPITISNATQYISKLGEENIVLNTPFSIIRTFGEQPLARVEFFDADKLSSIYSPIHTPSDSATMDKKNVVVLIIESLGSEYIGAYNRDKHIENYVSYTPFLDSLIPHSSHFLMSVASGKKSIDAMASVFASVPSLVRPFILTPYSHNDIVSLPKVLKNEGYATSFFHGAPNGSMGMLAYSKKLEIEQYFGKSEYDEWRPDNSDFDNIWGIWDDKFFEFFSYKLDSFKEPFFSSIFTLSSHHPFKVPQEWEGKFNKGEVEMHQVIGYTDYALKQFFKRAAESEWYKNTIFVITGDHTNQSAYPYYRAQSAAYRVPVIIFDPSKEGEGKDITASQIDIFPTVLSYLGYDKSFFSFGTNLLGDIAQSGENFAINHTGGSYNIFYRDYMLIFDGSSSLALYNIVNDPMMVSDMSETEPQVKAIMEEKIKAFIQEFNNRMIDNRVRLD